MVYHLETNHKIWTLKVIDRAFIVEKQKRFWVDYALRILSYRAFGKFVAFTEVSNEVLGYINEQFFLGENVSPLAEPSEKTARVRNKEVLYHIGIRSITDKDRTLLKTNVFVELSVDSDFHSFETTVLRLSVLAGHKPPTLTWMSRVYTSRQSKFDKVQFKRLHGSLSEKARKALVQSIRGTGEVVSLLEMRAHPGSISKANFDAAIARLRFSTGIEASSNIFDQTHPSWRKRVSRRVQATRPSSFREFSIVQQVGLYSVYLHEMKPALVDSLVEAFCDAVIKFTGKGERTVKNEVAKHAERVREREMILRDLLELALNEPERQLGRTVSLRVGNAKARQIIASIDLAGGFHEAVLAEFKRSWFNHYRSMLPKLMGVIDLGGGPESKYLLEGLNWLSEGFDGEMPKLSGKGVRRISYIQQRQEDLVFKGGFDEEAFEVYTIIALKDAIIDRKIWVDCSVRYRNPTLDIPQDFEVRRTHYYEQLNQPKDPRGFTARLKKDMEREVLRFNNTLPQNRSVFLNPENKWLLKRYQPLAEPRNLAALKQDLFSSYPNLPLIDVLKEAGLDTGFLRKFKSLLTTSRLPAATVNEHLLLALYGLGTNVGLSAMASASDRVTEDQLRHIKASRIDFHNLVEANQTLAQSILRVRDPKIWGEPGIACASDSKQYPAWDNNPIAQKHLRYGSTGIMVYWHVERRALCLFSRVKRVSTPEIAPMLHGILHHGLDDVDIERHFTDSHGQTEIAFGFCHLLGYDLAPRIKRIAYQQLYLPDINLRSRLNNIFPMCRRAINWCLIEEYYDELIQYATALREGGDPAPLMRLFRRGNSASPHYRAAAELGRVIKTIYVCRYLRSESLRREVQEGLNVMENWNGATKFTYFGRGGAFTSNKMEEMQISTQALQLLQNSMVYVNTRLFQSVLDRPEWKDKVGEVDLGRISPLICDHINIMGKVDLNMLDRLVV